MSETSDDSIGEREREKGGRKEKERTRTRELETVSCPSILPY